MSSTLIGYIGASILTIYLFGWLGVFVVFIVSLAAWFGKEQKKPGPIVSFINKLGE